MKRLVLALISGLFLAWVALIGWDRWVNAHRIVAGPENQTAFYRSYDPEQVIKHFRYDESYGSGHGSGALQLIKSIKHSEDFTPAFTMRADREQELLNALREDIVQRLRINGTNVTSIHDEPGGGFTCKYASGNSIGSISVQPLAHQKTVRRYPVPPGLDDVNLTVTLEERWTRPADDLRWWMSAVD